MRSRERKCTVPSLAIGTPENSDHASVGASRFKTDFKPIKTVHCRRVDMCWGQGVHVYLWHKYVSASIGGRRCKQIDKAVSQSLPSSQLPKLERANLE